MLPVQEVASGKGLGIKHGQSHPHLSGVGLGSLVRASAGLQAVGLVG